MRTHQRASSRSGPHVLPAALPYSPVYGYDSPEADFLPGVSQCNLHTSTANNYGHDQTDFFGHFDDDPPHVSTQVGAGSVSAPVCQPPSGCYPTATEGSTFSAATVDQVTQLQQTLQQTMDDLKGIMQSHRRDTATVCSPCKVNTAQPALDGFDCAALAKTQIRKHTDKTDLENDIKSFVAKHQQHGVLKSRQKSNAKRFTMKCLDKRCKFNVVCTRPKGTTWGVRFDDSTDWTHGGADFTCLSKPQLSVDLTSDPAVRAIITAYASYDNTNFNAVKTALGALGYDTEGQKDTVTRLIRRLCKRVFGSDEPGMADHLSKLESWVDSFNTVNDGANGRATLHTPFDPETGSKVFHSLTIVFDVSVAAFMGCAARVLDVDAAHLSHTRSDLRYQLVEMHTANNKIVPLAFHLCFGESEATYSDMWTHILAYSDGLHRRIDSLDTRINGDRHCGLRNAIENLLEHGEFILHSDPVHLKRNVRTNVRMSAGTARKADMLIF
jgi:hypothetical protein